MDTISRENNSMLPVGGIIVGVIALLLGGYAAITITKLNKTVTEQEAKLAKIDAIESAANSAASAAEKAARESSNVAKDLSTLSRTTQAAFNDVGPILVKLQESVTKLEAAKAPAGGKDKKGSSEPVVAGPGEYVVKPGDSSGAKIARDHGVSLADLQAVNPGVNWNKLKIGDKLKLPSTGGTTAKK